MLAHPLGGGAIPFELAECNSRIFVTRPLADSTTVHASV